jgi:hypothetical protein
MSDNGREAHELNVGFYQELCNFSTWFRITIRDLLDDSTTYDDRVTAIDQAVSDHVSVIFSSLTLVSYVPKRIRSGGMTCAC